MSALYFDQLERQKTMRGEKRFSVTNLDSHIRSNHFSHYKA